jgi:hypothetical protein
MDALSRPGSGVLADVVRLLIGRRGTGGLGDPGGRPAQARPDDLGQHALGGPLVAGLFVGSGLGRDAPVDEDPVTLRR